MSAGAFLLRGALGVGALQVVSLVLSFGSAVVLARTLGEAGFGSYSYVLTWVLVLLGPATFGLGPVLTRETAAGMSLGQFGRVKAVRAFAVRTTGFACAAVVASSVLALVAFQGVLDPAHLVPMLVGIPLVALSAVALVCRHLLLGLRKVVRAQVAESVLRPGIVLVGVGACWVSGRPVDAVVALGIYGLGTAVGIAFLLWQIRHSVPDEVRDAAPEPDATWLRSAAPLLVTGIARDVNAEAGTLVIGSLLTADDVGLFRAATRLASLPTYTLSAMNLALQPVAATLFAKGELKQLEILGVRASRVAALLSLPIVAGFFLWGEPLLTLFGPGFSRAAPALRVLALGHFFNVASGSVGVILVACKREDDAARGLVLSCIITLAANGLFISWYGLIGAASATALGLVVWNVALTWFCLARLGIVPAAYSWRRLRW